MGPRHHAVWPAAVAWALVGASSPALAAPEAESLERVEITGSHIRRLGRAGMLPVEVHRRKDIESTGAATLSEWMRSVPALDLNDLGELAGDVPGLSGAAMARFRGLNESSVLVLLNGRRLPVNALHDVSGIGAAVDLNLIPLQAIDRIEILKDGASAVYGADALAGVLNIITRRDWQGVQLSAGAGRGSLAGGAQSQASLVVGHAGEAALAPQWLGVLDVFRRSPILRRERSISASADFRSLGGPDARSSFSPFGNLVDADYAFTGATVRPCPPALLNGYCRFDFNADVLTAYNGADRVGGLLTSSWPLSASWRLESDLLLSTSQLQLASHAVPDVFTTAAGESYYGRFLQGGPRLSDRRASLQHLTLALKGETETGAAWVFELGEGRQRVVNRDRNYFNRTAWQAALADGSLDPTSTANDEALVEALRIQPERHGLSTLRFGNARVSGPLPSANLTDVRYAMGLSWWQEGLSDRPDALTQQGDVIGGIQQSAVLASRRALALHAELSVPLSDRLETQWALRHDRYPTASSSSPKVSARYALSPSLGLSGSLSRSFRMPSLKQLYGTREEGAGDFTSDALCAAQGQAAGCVLSGFEVWGANPALKPERGHSANLGLAWTPADDLRTSFGWWRLSVRDAIATPTIDQSVAAGLYGRDADGRLTVQTQLVNFARVRNEGLDLGFQWRSAPLPGWRWTVGSTSTHYLSQQRQREPGAAWEEFNGTYNRPRWRHVLTLGVESAEWTGHLAVRRVGGFRDTDEPAQVGAVSKVPSHTEIDSVLRWSLTRAVRVDLAIMNLLNRMPPFSAQNAVSNQYAQLGHAELYAARGRYVQAGLTCTFD